MSIKTPLANPWLLLSAALLLLPACNSSYFSVEKSELAALEQCQQSQQSQQYLILQQQARLDETLSLLQENLELQKRQAVVPPPEPTPQPAPVVCPKPPKPLPVVTNAQALFQDKQLVGDKERVLLTAIDVLLRARINTGFSMSELDARNVQMFERNGEEWVRFTVIDRKTETPYELERKRLRYEPASGDARRPVVELRVTIGKITQSAEFILEDRSSQPFPLLIGRNVLRDVMLVDVSRSDLAPVKREPKEVKPEVKPAKATPASASSESAKEPATENSQP